MAKPGTKKPYRARPRCKYILLAIAGPTSAQEASLRYEDLTRYLEEHLGTPVQLVLRKTYAEVNNLLHAGTVQLGIVSSYAYLLGKQDFGLEALVAPELNAGETFHSYILVHRDSDIKSPEGLHSRTFAFTDPDSTTGKLYPVTLFLQHGLAPDIIFRHHIYTYSTDNAIRSVSNRLVDGAGVNNLVFDRLACQEKYITDELRIIHISPPLPLNPIVVSPKVCPAGKEKLENIFVAMHQNDQGSAILAALGYSRFVVPDSSLYDSIGTLLDSFVKGELE